jgi:predicted peptidase
MSQTAKKINIETKKVPELNYLEYLPENYNSKDGKKYPLIIFLHGAGERGNDIEKVKVHGIPKLVEQKAEVLQKYEFIAISPQCPSGQNWNAINNALIKLIKNCIEELNVDTSRIYLTGLSMGGFGTWNLICKYPHAFAAAAPICGGLSGDGSEKLNDITHVPLWVFHGAKDTAVHLSGSANPVAKLNELDANVKFTVYPELEHDSWTITYNNPNFYKWLFNQKNDKYKF